MLPSSTKPKALSSVSQAQSKDLKKRYESFSKE